MARFTCGALLVVFLWASSALGLDDARMELGADRAAKTYGLTGKGVLVAVIDRGLDYAHPAFRQEGGSSRIEAIFDLTDDAGAEDEGNPHGFGTIYERGQIESALATGKALKPQDKEGRGTCSVGIACGNGAGSPRGKYRGIAPEASILFVKIKLDPAVDLATLDLAEEIDEEDGEVEFFELRRLRIALDFCLARARKLKMPLVVLLNFGQVGGPTDGQSKLCRTIDEMFGPGKPGLVFVTPSGDNGDRHIHAVGRVPPNRSVALQVTKEAYGELIVDIWYPSSDRFDVRIETPRKSYGPYAAPKTGSSEQSQEFQYYHLASTRNLNLAKDAKRQIRVDLRGPPGKYVIRLLGNKVESGRFDAFLGPTPENPMDEPYDQFESLRKPGSLWDGATAEHAICVGCYVGRTEWTNIQGRGLALMGEGKRDELWLGSSTGPTADGRPGVTVCAPGDRIITTYAKGSEWAERRTNLVADEGGLYGISSGTTCAGALVTGVIALMLQRNPTLDAVQVKEILQATARADKFVGAVPNPRWGHGKVDAFAALKRVPGWKGKKSARKRRR